MNCTGCKEKLVELAEGLLSESQSQIVKEHLKDCQQCRSELEELKELGERLTCDSEKRQQGSLEDAVFNQIIRQQRQLLKQADRNNRQLRIWRQIMNSKITKLATAAVIIMGILFSLQIFNASEVSAAQVLQEAMDAVSDLQSVYMKAKMRTRPSDNFSNIGLNYDFAEIEMWKHTNSNGLVQWRVEKPGRILLMDGTNTTMFMRPNGGVLIERPLPLGCYDSWSGRLLNVHDLLDSELQKAKNNPDREVSLWHKEIEGQDKIILEVDVITDVAEDDYLRNKFIMDSDHLKVYQFDTKTKLLEGLQVYVHTDNEDVLVFEVTDIEYNAEFDDGIFALDLPENMNWAKELEILPDNKRYEDMAPKEVATVFFQACADEDWEEVLKFWGASRIDDRIKDYLGGLEIISIGEPFQSVGYVRGGWFIPYEIKLKSGDIQKHNLSIRNDNKAKRYNVDGGI